MSKLKSKIPPHAERVFQGEIFSIYQWEQELFDGSTATFECAKRPNTAVVIPLVGDQVLYAEQEQPGRPPFLSLFGGRAEGDEEPLVTAKRELLEETGLTSENWEELKVYSAPSKLEWHIYFYIVRDCQKVAEPNLDPGEKIEVKQTSIEDFINNIVMDDRFLEKELRRDLITEVNPSAVAKAVARLKG